MILTFTLLVVSAAVIYLSCEYFVNGIEWAGVRLGVSKNAVGTVLAAFGTALPESVVTFVAVVLGDSPAQKDIGVGAAIGGPLALGTIAYAVVGLVFVLDRKEKNGALLLPGSTQTQLLRDQAWFMGIFVFKIALGLVVFAGKPWLGALFLAAYGVYVWYEMRREHEGEPEQELEPLKLRPNQAQPSTGWVLLQTTAALVVIFLASQLFVHQLDAVGPSIGMPPQMVALLLSPIATELPEILNAVIWVRQGKQSLAFGNISGAMMIQATVPSALGIIFTPWILSPASIWAAVVTMISIAGLYALLRRGALSPGRLSLFGVLYLAFAAGLFLLRS